MTQYHLPPVTIPRDYKLADTYHERIEQNVREFMDELKDDEVLSVTVILSDGQRVHAEWFGYHNPSMIIVAGKDDSGNTVQALLPHTNIQILLTATKKQPDQKKRPIGFQTRTDGEESQS